MKKWKITILSNTGGEKNNSDNRNWKHCNLVIDKHPLTWLAEYKEESDINSYNESYVIDFYAVISEYDYFKNVGEF